jgi:hypothetical protein
MNRRPASPRTSGVAAASVAGGRGDETDVAGAVHQILATLTDVRRSTSASELCDRIALVQWLRLELAAVETLLAAAHARQAAADATTEPGRAG